MSRATKHVLDAADCDPLLEKAREPMIERRVHVHAYPHDDETGALDGLVVVARGEAAQRIYAFIRDQVPSFEEAERAHPVNLPTPDHLGPLTRRTSYVPIADEMVRQLDDWSEPVQVRAERQANGLVDLIFKRVAR